MAAREREREREPDSFGAPAIAGGETTEGGGGAHISGPRPHSSERSQPGTVPPRLGMILRGWASVLKTHSSRETTVGGENKRYRYLSVSARK